MITGNERFLVLGSNSFSGATFVDFLAARGYDVLATSRSAETHRALLPYQWQQRKGRVRFVKIDLNHDLDSLKELLIRERPTHIVNFAAQSMVGESWKNPDHWMMTNVVSAVRLHERLRHLDFLERYVHVTTPEVYGSSDGFIKEETPFRPSTPYAVSRAASDMSLRTYFEAYKFPVLFTRAANVYGPGQQLYRIIPRTILFIRLGKKLPLHGGGHSVRSFIHIRDVAEATLRIARAGAPGSGYHLSTDRFVSIRELVEMICARLGQKFADVAEVTDDRPGKDAAYLLDSTRARTTLGWQDRVSLEDGIAETVRWVDEHLDYLKAQPLDYIHKQ